MDRKPTRNFGITLIRDFMNAIDFDGERAMRAAEFQKLAYQWPEFVQANAAADDAIFRAVALRYCLSSEIVLGILPE